LAAMCSMKDGAIEGKRRDYKKTTTTTKNN